MQLWIEEVLTPMDHETALQLARGFVRTADEAPSVAEFRKAYFDAKHRAVEEDVPDTNALDPQTRDEWERKAQEHREWRHRHYPEVTDPAAGKPLPRNRLDFNREWGTWFKLKFGWTPETGAS